MKRITLGRFVLVFAALFGTVPFGSPAAFARSDSAKGPQITHPQYRIRGSGHAQHSKKKAEERAEKSVRKALQHQDYLGTITQKKRSMC